MTCRCAPSGAASAKSADKGADREVLAGGCSDSLRQSVLDLLRDIPGGFAEMGAPKSRYAADLDSPRRRIRLDPFQISATCITNALFAQFVAESGHRTTAEREGWSFVFHLGLSDPGAFAAPPGTPWWRQVKGADWAHPEGPGSSVAGREDHPVVHVSWDDAVAFARFTGTALPSEAQWEHAARGGLRRMKFPWGNELAPGGTHRCNTWQGSFPMENSAADGHSGTAPAQSYMPNGYGLYNMSGNVWEWVADWFGPLPAAKIPPLANPGGPSEGQGRVIRGGSHLCCASYCERYFVHSRSHNTPASTTGHMGFRLACPIPPRPPVAAK
ncbi:formylglycine-generating enzyme family protein [Xinfangfangia sp. D13-10-4-6]|uniref:formylglycine-generating enzyme family protein n=1 Tax=Pseudogemmobacter hezensis TaxID=2737662 RepID=UPI0015556E2D|nr:formylglycine-generating enzyme family protein [Pseudogemmobacter hezensis]NPD14338.1 formylglycine-generating enzyme family protein [Pseudogemmobacter hezensis]